MKAPSNEDREAAEQSVKALLREVGMRQRSLAEVAGVSPTTVSKWVTGKRKVPGGILAYLNLKKKVKEE